MKRVFLGLLVLVTCISLCVNVVFASDVITASVAQNIFVYFPWFGGVGSAGSRVTNNGTVTSSDITSDVINVTNSTVAVYTGTASGITYSNSNGIFYYSGTASSTVTTYAAAFTPTSGHKYLIDTFYTGNFDGFIIAGTTYMNTIYTATGNTRVGLNTKFINGQYYDYSVGWFVVDLTSSFGVGNEPTSVEEARSAIGSFTGGYHFFTGTVSNALSQFSLVPMPATQGGGSSHQIKDYTWYQYEADISLLGDNYTGIDYSDYLYDTPYSYFYANTNNTGSFTGTIIYAPSDGSAFNSNWVKADRDMTAQVVYLDYTLGAVTPTLYSWVSPGQWSTGSNRVNSNTVRVYLDPEKTSNINISGSLKSIDVYIPDAYRTWDNNNLGVIGNYVLSSDYLIDLSYNYLNGSEQVTGTFSIDRIFQTADNSYFLMNNEVQLGTYDFNINVKFPSLAAYNSFSAYWMGSFNTSWGEIPVRTQIQEVSANSVTLIKIYKVTFDVPFSGQYTKFNIKYVGDSSAFTTIRLDASVVDSNAYLNGAGPTTINGFSFFLSSKLDQFWAKIRSLFFDQDQTYEAVAQSSASSELAEGSAEVSEGASTIHEYETENFDSIEQQMESLDWDIPNDFGSASDPNSAIGFISTFFGGIFLSLGSKVQVLIVIPLMLGLCLLILGRGSQALGAINKLFR